MIRLTLTWIPRGDERRAKDLGTVEIEDDCTGDDEIGNYKVRSRGEIHRDVGVRGFRRSAHGSWLLALEALRKILESR